MLEAAAVLPWISFRRCVDRGAGNNDILVEGVETAFIFWRQRVSRSAGCRGGSDLVPVVVAFLGLVRAEPKSGTTRRARRRTF